MVLEKNSKIIRLNPKGATLALIIPADIVKDSVFQFEEGSVVKITVDPEKPQFIVNRV
jgi:antitoxin component of MazEF toxin-antitoxin module